MLASPPRARGSELRASPAADVELPPITWRPSRCRARRGRPALLPPTLRMEASMVNAVEEEVLADACEQIDVLRATAAARGLSPSEPAAAYGGCPRPRTAILKPVPMARSSSEKKLDRSWASSSVVGERISPVRPVRPSGSECGRRRRCPNAETVRFCALSRLPDDVQRGERPDGDVEAGGVEVAADLSVVRDESEGALSGVGFVIECTPPWSASAVAARPSGVDGASIVVAEVDVAKHLSRPSRTCRLVATCTSACRAVVPAGSPLDTSSLRLSVEVSRWSVELPALGAEAARGSPSPDVRPGRSRASAAPSPCRPSSPSPRRAPRRVDRRVGAADGGRGGARAASAASTPAARIRAANARSAPASTEVGTTFALPDAGSKRRAWWVASHATCSIRGGRRRSCVRRRRHELEPRAESTARCAKP